MRTFTAYIEYDDDSRLYVGMIPSVPGAHTQGESLEEPRENLKEVLEMCLKELGEGEESLDFPQFIGLQQIEVGV